MLFLLRVLCCFYYVLVMVAFTMGTANPFPPWKAKNFLLVTSLQQTKNNTILY